MLLWEKFVRKSMVLRWTNTLRLRGYSGCVFRCTRIRQSDQIMRINSYKLRVILAYFQFSRVSFVGRNIVAVILCRSLSRYTRRPQGENTRNQIFYLFLLENTFAQTRALSRFNLWQITDKTLTTYPLTSFDLISCFYSFRRYIKTLLFSHRRT